MNDTSLRTVTLDSESLDAAIDVLSSATASFRLTRRERTGYRALMVSVDLLIVSLAFIFLMSVFLLMPELKLAASGHSSVPAPTRKHIQVVADAETRDWVKVAGAVVASIAVITFFGAIVVGAFAFLLNVPLFRRTLRERARLKTLGVTALSESLWKASRQHHWLSRIRSTVIVVLGVVLALGAIEFLIFPFVFERKGSLLSVVAVVAVFYAVAAVLLFGARYLRDQREQMDLAANAIELKKALQSLRQRAGARTVAVPAELVERVAKIESAHIARERKEAILQSAGSQSSGYAITFEDKAAAQRAALGVTDRLELEDLLAYLSTTGHPPETKRCHWRAAARALVARRRASMWRSSTRSNRSRAESASRW